MEVRGQGTSERRIARRIAPDDLRVSVEVAVPRLLRRRRVDRLECVVVNVSVTGALLLAPVSPMWTFGETVVLRGADPATSAEVAIMRVSAAAAGYVNVGVDFRRQTPRFKTIVNDIIAERATASEWRWHHPGAH